MRRWISPREQRARTERRLRAAALVLALLLVIVLLDRPVFLALYDAQSAARYEKREWYQMLRIVGYYPAWVFIGAALLLHAMRPWPVRLGNQHRDPRVPRWLLWPSWLAWPTNWSGILIMLSAGMAGLVCDLGKAIPGRLRPLQTGGYYRFHGSPDDLLHGASFGLPSSHAAVAFGAAFMVWFYWRWPGAVALAAAAGCGVTRLLTGAHFVSDVFVSALVAYAMAYVLRPRGRGGLHGS
jgi:membrane-associated phospholipid phosphatase